MEGIVMLSTSYQAFYELELLRSHANMSARLLTEHILHIPASTYSKIKHDIEAGKRGGLSGKIDIKVRIGLNILIKGFEIHYLPLPIGSSDYKLRCKVECICSLVDEYGGIKICSDRAGYFSAHKKGILNPEPLEQTFKQAKRFAGV